jgi:signal transduction histidine kinase
VVEALRRARTWAAAHPALVDALVAAGFLAAAIVALLVDLRLMASADPGYRAPPLALLVTTTGALTVPLAWRRLWPLSVVGTVVTGFLTARLTGNPDVEVAMFAMPLAVYSAAAYGGDRRGWVLSAVTAAAMGELSYELLDQIPQYDGLVLAQAFDFLYNLTAFLFPWALGASVRLRRQHEAELQRHAADLESRRMEDARRAVFEERVRIARELHDVVAHHVSVMGVQAGAARRVLDRRPDRAAQSLETIEQTSRQAVVELQRLLGFLRQEDESDGVAPQPKLSELDRLLGTLGDDRLHIRVHVEGPPRQLPESLELSAYRIVQEACTNVLKHSTASQVLVRLAYEPDRFGVEIRNDGMPRRKGRHTRGGHGLIGMRERVALHSGELLAAPLSSGGFQVRATFPMEAAEP